MTTVDWIFSAIGVYVALLLTLMLVAVKDLSDYVKSLYVELLEVKKRLNGLQLGMSEIVEQIHHDRAEERSLRNLTN